MYTGLKHLHSSLPYLLLPLLIISVVIFLVKWLSGGRFGKSDKLLGLISMILAHLQFVVGLVLYFISPLVKQALGSGELMKNETHRFHGVEHISIMIIAVIVLTIGYSRSKRKPLDKQRFKTLTIFYLIGVLLMLSRIPWDVWPSAMGK